jgi:hypothetical protein
MAIFIFQPPNQGHSKECQQTTVAIYPSSALSSISWVQMETNIGGRPRAKIRYITKCKDNVCTRWKKEIVAAKHPALHPPLQFSWRNHWIQSQILLFFEAEDGCWICWRWFTIISIQSIKHLNRKFAQRSLLWSNLKTYLFRFTATRVVHNPAKLCKCPSKLSSTILQNSAQAFFKSSDFSHN